MSPNPTHRVLSTIQRHRVRYLLMGGQACVLYGGVQFSSDIDLTVVADPSNLEFLRAAIDELQASVVAVPPFDAKYLEMGLAVHFRCQHPDVDGLRIDVMSKMRNVDNFDDLWSRRTTLMPEGAVVEMISLADLVKAKKTQRDKDWPMIESVVSYDFTRYRNEASEERLRFWFMELRTPSLLIELAKDYPDRCQAQSVDRPLLALATAANAEALRHALLDEQLREQELDRQYWMPLRKVLEQLRQERRQT